MSDAPQNYANHAKMVPVYHYLGSLLMLALLGWTGLRLVRAPSVDTVMAFLLLVLVILGYFYGRLFALGVQDRVIRLEERLRMDRLFSDDLKARIGDFTTEQLIGLRFATDEDLPALARRVLDEGISDRKTIKQAVKTWRPDHQRI